MTENFLSHEKSMKINKNKKKDPFIELDFVSANNSPKEKRLCNSNSISLKKGLGSKTNLISSKVVARYKNKV